MTKYTSLEDVRTDVIEHAQNYSLTELKVLREAVKCTYDATKAGLDAEQRKELTRTYRQFLGKIGYYQSQRELMEGRSIDEILGDERLSPGKRFELVGSYVDHHRRHGEGINGTELSDKLSAWIESRTDLLNNDLKHYSKLQEKLFEGEPVIEEPHPAEAKTAVDEVLERASEKIYDIKFGVGRRITDGINLDEPSAESAALLGYLQAEKITSFSPRAAKLVERIDEQLAHETVLSAEGDFLTGLRAYLTQKGGIIINDHRMFLRGYIVPERGAQGSVVQQDSNSRLFDMTTNTDLDNPQLWGKTPSGVGFFGGLRKYAGRIAAGVALAITAVGAFAGAAYIDSRMDRSVFDNYKDQVVEVQAVAPSSEDVQRISLEEIVDGSPVVFISEESPDERIEEYSNKGQVLPVETFDLAKAPNLTGETLVPVETFKLAEAPILVGETLVPVETFDLAKAPILVGESLLPTKTFNLEDLPVLSGETELPKEDFVLDPCFDAQTVQPVLDACEPAIMPILDNVEDDNQTPELNEPFIYEVQKGDTLWGIGRKLCHDQYAWHDIKEDNGIANSRDLEVGQRLAVQCKEEPKGGGEYLIMPGESWNRIAKQIYGDESFAKELRETNPGAKMWPGRTIWLPRI